SPAQQHRGEIVYVSLSFGFCLSDQFSGMHIRRRRECDSFSSSAAHSVTMDTADGCRSQLKLRLSFTGRFRSLVGYRPIDKSGSYVLSPLVLGSGPSWCLRAWPMPVSPVSRRSWVSTQ